MSEPLDLWRQTAAKWSEIYGQVTGSQWEQPTPCVEWTVRQLVDHTLGWQAEGGRLTGPARLPLEAAARPARNAIGQTVATWPSWGSMQPRFSTTLKVPASELAMYMFIRTWC